MEKLVVRLEGFVPGTQKCGFLVCGLVCRRKKSETKRLQGKWRPGSHAHTRTQACDRLSIQLAIDFMSIITFHCPCECLLFM